MRRLTFLLFICLLASDLGAQSVTTYGTKGAYGNGGSYVSPATTRDYGKPASTSNYNSTPTYRPSSSSGSSYTPASSSPSSSYSSSPSSSQDEYNPFAALSSTDVRKSSAYCRTHADSVYWFGEAGIAKMNYEATADTRDQVFGYTQGLALVRKSERYGFMDVKGDMVIPIQYESALSFMEDGTSIVQKNGKFGVINTHGDILLPLQYDHLGTFYKDEIAQVGMGDKWGFIRRDGSIAIPIEYEKVGYSFDEGLLPVRKDGKWGYINLKGETILPFEYDYADAFRDGQAVVYIRERRYSIDKEGNRHRLKK